MRSKCFVLALVTVTTVCFGQNLRIHSTGELDYAPSSAQFILSADKIANLKEIQYSVDLGPVQVYSGPLVLEGEGRHTINYRSVDLSGTLSKEKVYTVVIDDTPPTLSASAKGSIHIGDDSYYFKSDTGIVVMADDAGSGLEGIYVSLNGKGFSRYSDVVYVEAEGSYVGYAYAVDRVGNRTITYSLSFVVDDSPPTVTILPSRDLILSNGAWYAAMDTTFRIETEDGGAGIMDVWVSVDDEAYMVYTGPLAIKEHGIHRIVAKAVDRVGNESEPTRIDFSVGLVPPEPELEATVGK